MTPTLYKEDFYQWTQHQAALLRSEDYAELDIDNLIEELEDMGSNTRHALTSHLVGLLMHLLKYAHQKQRRSQSWLNSITNHRTEIESRANPRLRLATLICYEDPKASVCNHWPLADHNR